ncbi:MAG: hypothetical protein ACRBC3_01955 [Burkholderiaceae bacterium]
MNTSHYSPITGTRVTAKDTVLGNIPSNQMAGKLAATSDDLARVEP